jgi:DNA-binding MarR family transcriptional regulator
VPTERFLKHPGHRSVGWALVQAARLHRSRMGDKLAELGLFAGQEQVLQALAASGLMTMGELAGLLRVRPPTASKTVSRLAAMSLVERHAEPDDARVVRVKLTEAGLAKAQAIDHLWGEVERELLDGFESKERRRLRKSLRRVARISRRSRASTRAGLEAGPDEDLDGPWRGGADRARRPRPERRPYPTEPVAR